VVEVFEVLSAQNGASSHFLEFCKVEFLPHFDFQIVFLWSKDLAASYHVHHGTNARWRSRCPR